MSKAAPPSFRDRALLSAVRLLPRLGDAYRHEIEALGRPGGFDFTNEYFAGLDAAMYYALIRDLNPARVIEIGSGMSTRIADAGELGCGSFWMQRIA